MPFRMILIKGSETAHRPFCVLNVCDDPCRNIVNIVFSGKHVNIAFFPIKASVLLFKHHLNGRGKNAAHALSKSFLDKRNIRRHKHAKRTLRKK